MLSRCLCLWVAGWLVTAAPGGAATLRIAAAANLRGTLDRIVEQYGETSSSDALEISITYGSTGKLYAQVAHGAPFDLFLGADVEHARRLEEEGLALDATRFTYALGQLALWGRSEPASKRELGAASFAHLVIPSPRVAPYGRAAREALEALDLWDRLEPLLVYGEDVGKAFHFVESGAAELGFVPLSWIRKSSVTGSTWVVPRELYAPIEQQAVQLRDIATARSFLEFMRSADARETLESRGYALP